MPKVVVRRAERDRIVASIAEWLHDRARYFGDDGGPIRTVASDLANGEWDEDTLGGTAPIKGGRR